MGCGINWFSQFKRTECHYRRFANMTNCKEWLKFFAFMLYTFFSCFFFPMTKRAATIRSWLKKNPLQKFTRIHYAHTHTHSAAAFHSDYYPQMCNFSWIHYSHTFPMWIQLIWNFLRSIEFRVIYGIEFMAFNLPCCCCCYCCYCYCCSCLEQSSITQHVSIGVSIKYYN